MKWTCSAVRRRLAEYHDGELTIDQRVAIQSHLSACPACAAEELQLHMVTAALRSATVERAYAVDSDVLDGLAAGVISRLTAEQQESFPYAVRRMFEDLHLVWAALSATAATCVCLALTIGIVYFSGTEHPDSIAAFIGSRANLGTDSNPMQVGQVPKDPFTKSTADPQITLPRQELERIASVPQLTTDEDILVDATIDSKGRVANLQLMNTEGLSGPGADWQTVGAVLDSIAQARFEPARAQTWRGTYFSGAAGEPVAVKMFWYFTHTTVRAKANGEARHGAPQHPATHVVATTIV